MFSTATIFIVTTILSDVFVGIFGNPNEEDGEDEGNSQSNSVDFENSDDILPTSHVFAALTLNPRFKSSAFASRSFDEQSLLRKSLSLNVPKPMNASDGNGRNNLVISRSQSLNIERKERAKVYKELDHWFGKKKQKNPESDERMRNIVANWRINKTLTGGLMPLFEVRELDAKNRTSGLSDRKDKMPKKQTMTGGLMPLFEVRELDAKNRTSGLSDRKDKMPKANE